MIPTTYIVETTDRSFTAAAALFVAEKSVPRAAGTLLLPHFADDVLTTFRVEIVASN
jgi:hypothetical protein